MAVRRQGARRRRARPVAAALGRVRLRLRLRLCVQRRPLAGAHAGLLRQRQLYSSSTRRWTVDAERHAERGAVSFGMVSHIDQLSENKTWGKNETYGAVAHYATGPSTSGGARPSAAAAPAPVPRPSKPTAAPPTRWSPLSCRWLWAVRWESAAPFSPAPAQARGAASVPLLGDDDLKDVELGSGGSDGCSDPQLPRTRDADPMRDRRAI